MLRIQVDDGRASSPVAPMKRAGCRPDEHLRVLLVVVDGVPLVVIRRGVDAHVVVDFVWKRGNVGYLRKLHFPAQHVDSDRAGEGGRYDYEKKQGYPVRNRFI